MCKLLKSCFSCSHFKIKKIQKHFNFRLTSGQNQSCIQSYSRDLRVQLTTKILGNNGGIYWKHIYRSEVSYCLSYKLLQLMIHYLYTLILVTHIYDSFSVTHRKCVGLNINNVCSCSWTILESIFYLAKNTIVRVNSLEPCLTLCTRRRGHCYIQYPALVRP